MAFDRKVYAGMAEQLERVNAGDPTPPREIPLQGRNGAKAPAPMPIANIPFVRHGEAPLLQRIQQLEAELARAQAQLATYQQREHQDYSGRRLNGRLVITAQQAAKITGLSIAQVSRYCNDGWQAEKDASGRWLIYADQPLSKRSRGKKRK